MEFRDLEKIKGTRIFSVSKKTCVASISSFNSPLRIREKKPPAHGRGGISFGLTLAPPSSFVRNSLPAKDSILRTLNQHNPQPGEK